MMVRYRKDLSDWEIEEAQKGLMETLARGFVKREPLRFEPQKPVQAKKKKKKRNRDEQGNQARQGGLDGKQSNSQGGGRLKGHGFEINEDLRELLESIKNHPNWNLTTRAQKLGYSADKYNKLKSELVNKGLIVQFSVDLGKVAGGRVGMLRLTEDGHRAIGNEPPKRYSPRQGSLEHLFWQINIANDYSRNGFKVQIEKKLNNVKAADIGVSDGKEWIAVEVELSPKNILHNFTEDVDAGFSRVIVACKNNRVITQARKQIESLVSKNPTYEGKYRIVLLSDFPFVKELINEIRGE